MILLDITIIGKDKMSPMVTISLEEFNNLKRLAEGNDIRVRNWDLTYTFQYDKDNADIEKLANLMNERVSFLRDQKDEIKAIRSSLWKIRNRNFIERLFNFDFNA